MIFLLTVIAFQQPEQEAPGLLNWGDVLKISLSLCSAIIVVVIRNFIARLREIRFKRSALFTELEASKSRLTGAENRLDEIINVINRDEPKITIFDIPSIPIELARDLSKVDPKHAHLYSDYVSFAEIINKGYGLVLDLYKSYITTPNDRIKETLIRQIEIFKGDLNLLSGKEVKILNTKKP
jgi:hypothetical protein